MVCLTDTPRIDVIYSHFLMFNFIADPGALMPYVPVAARGPWIITMHGAVVHDNGGYGDGRASSCSHFQQFVIPAPGMLGFGHNAEFLESAVCSPQCMANIMTPSFSQHSFFEEFVKHVGFTRKSGNPYSRVFAMNSGSEAVELSARLTDTHAKLMTDAGAVHEGRRSTMIVLEGSFYGRTYDCHFCFTPTPRLRISLCFQYLAKPRNCIRF
jgi:hypothetical protein